MLGQFSGMYDRFHWYDVFLHFISALVLGIVGFLIIYVFYSVNKLKLLMLIVVLFSFCFTATIGVIWEIITKFAYIKSFDMLLFRYLDSLYQ